MNESHIIYAQERVTDACAIEQMNAHSFGAARFTRAAFLIRERFFHDLELSLIALNDEKIVGSVRQTKIVIGKMPALLLGPLVVDACYKNMGIGGELMRRALAQAQTRGHGFVFLVGDRSYYERFGFKIHTLPIILPAPADPQRILVCELKSGQCAQAIGQVRALNSIRLNAF